MAKHITYESWIGTKTGTVEIDPERKRIQILTEDGVPYATCTAPLDGLADDEYAIKDWSENNGMLVSLMVNDIVLPPHRWVHSGFVDVPICRLR